MKFLPDPLRVVGSLIEWPPSSQSCFLWCLPTPPHHVSASRKRELKYGQVRHTAAPICSHTIHITWSWWKFWQTHVTDVSVSCWSDMLFSKHASKMYCRSLNADLPCRHSFHQIERKGYSQEGKLLTVLAADLMFPRQFPNWRQFSGEFSLNSFSAWEEHSDGVCMNRQSCWKLHFATQYIKSKRGCWILSSFGAKCKIVRCWMQ